MYQITGLIIMFFDRVSQTKEKLSHSFADLILINTIIPLQFAYAKSQGKEVVDDLILLFTSEKKYY
jgi:hypothetical protein